MADNNELQITLSLNDQLSQGLTKASKAVDDFGHNVKTLGAEIGKVSSAIGFFGAGIIAPFALALNNVSKSSVGVNAEFKRLGAATNEFQSSIANSVLPVVHQFTNDLTNLIKQFESIPKPIRDAILQGTLLTGVFLVMTSLVGKFTMEIFKLVGNIALLTKSFMAWLAVPANIVLLGWIALIGGLIIAMFKFKAVGDIVMNTFEIIFRSLWAGFLTIAGAIEGALSRIYGAIAKVYDLLAKIPGPQQGFFKMMAENARELSNTLEDLSKNSFSGVISQTEKLGDVLKGNGTFSAAFNSLKDGAANFFNEIKNGTAETVEDISKMQAKLQSLRDELEELHKENTNSTFLIEKQNLTELIDLEKFKQDQFRIANESTFEITKSQMLEIQTLSRNVGNSTILDAQRENNEKINLLKEYQTNYNIAHQGMNAFTVQLSQSIRTNLSGALTNIITGVQSAKEAFTQLGQQLLKTIVDFMVQKVVAFALEKTLLAGQVAAAVAAGSATAVAWSAAAAMVSLATLGANAAPAAAALVSTTALATALSVPKLAEGTDTVPAMLSPGEMVFPRSMADAIRQGAISVSGPGGSGGGGDVNIFMSGVTINSKDSVRELAEELGFEIERRSRSARSNI